MEKVGQTLPDNMLANIGPAREQKRSLIPVLQPLGRVGDNPSMIIQRGELGL